jgi:hypothetical protein
MPPASRLLFHGILQMLYQRPEVVADIPQLKCWLTLDRDYVRRALPPVIESGLLVVEELQGGEYRFTLPDWIADMTSAPRLRSDDVASTQRSRSGHVASTQRSRSDRVASTQRSRSAESSNDAGLEPAKTPLEENRIEENRKEKKRKEEKSAPVGAASAEPPSYYGALTLEEAQQVIAEYHEKYPYRERINDRHTGEPMSDMDWGHAIMMVWKQDRAKELGLTEKPKDPPKVTIMDTRAAGKVKVERPEDCDEQVWKDWMRVRGRNALTETAWGAMLGEARKAGITPAEAVRVCAERGWRGFRADWLSRDKVSRPGRREEVDIAAIWGRKPEFEREA